MTFIQFQEEPSRPSSPVRSEVPPEGNLQTSDICFIGEAPGKTELRYGKPFQGEAGTVFNHCLQAAGIIRGQHYITNLIKHQIPYKGITKYCSDRGLLTAKGQYCRDQLAEEINSGSFKILVPMGKPAMAAITGSGNITNRRGYLTHATEKFNELPTLPTLHPASCLYGGSYINKYYITHDFQKIKRLLEGNRLSSYDDTTCIFPSTLEEVCMAVQEMQNAGIFAYDIEVANYEVSAISLCSDERISYSICLCQEGLWTEYEEVQIWLALASILEDTSLIKVGQNLIFDNHFMIQHQGIFVKPPIIDTMIAHHIIYPDFLKGLGFLASIYTHRPYWKDMVSFKNLKKDN